MDPPPLPDQLIDDRIRLAEEFLDPDDERLGRPSYRRAIIEMLNRQTRRLIVNLDEIRTHSSELATGLLMQPFDFCPAFDQALKNIVAALPSRPREESGEDVLYHCAFVGSFGENATNPRRLGSSHLNRMVSMEGIVTKCSLVRPKIVKSVHWNEKKNIFHYRTYADQTMVGNRAPSTSVYPTVDSEGNAVCPPLALEEQPQLTFIP